MIYLGILLVALIGGLFAIHTDHDGPQWKPKEDINSGPVMPIPEPNTIYTGILGAGIVAVYLCKK